MAKKQHKKPVYGGKALELIMRDTLDGLQDSATCLAYSPTCAQLEILSIEPPKVVNFTPKVDNVVRVYPQQDIVDYLIQRELHFERLASCH